MAELAKRKPLFTLVSGRIGPTGPDTLTWTVEEVMKYYAFSYRDIESWGGKVLFPGPAVVGVPVVRDGQARAIFQEGAHHIMWEQHRLKHLQSLEIPLTPRLCTKCVIPLHKGAERYYREIGCL